MQWADVRVTHPETWLVIEALDARTTNHRRIIDRLAVVEVCADGAVAMRRYRDLHREHAERDLYFVHTRNRELEIEERPWLGIRGSCAPHTP